MPRKNIQLLASRPLLHYTAVCAFAASRLSKVVLSTDDTIIARVGKEYGLDVPFLRPSELAQDDTPMLPVVQHAIAYLEQQGEYFDAICLLQPTSPLRMPADIDACIELLEESGADAVVSVGLVPAKFNPHWTYFQDQSGCLRLSTGEQDPISRRQALPQAFYRDGSIFVTRRDICMEENSLYGRRVVGHLSQGPANPDIDTLEDWEQVQRLLEESRFEVMGLESHT